MKNIYELVMKFVGIMLTVIGSIFSVMSFILYKTFDEKLQLFMFLGIGIIFLMIGIPLLVLPNIKKKKEKRKIESLVKVNARITRFFQIKQDYETSKDTLYEIYAENNGIIFHIKNMFLPTGSEIPDFIEISYDPQNPKDLIAVHIENGTRYIYKSF